MDTQNTPIHINLWHREFWMMALANLLLMASAYMLVPALPTYLLDEGFSHREVGLVMGIYGLGTFAFGGFCSYWVQKYRRNHVCQIAILGVILSIAFLYYVDFVLDFKLEFWMLLVARFFLGAFLGLAQMTLSSTLVIDTCESFQRTEANYAMAWFSRFALALGPLASLLLYKWQSYEFVLGGACLMAICSLMLISLVKFPFKAPADNISTFSLDRFFLPQGILLFVNIMLIMTVVGLLFSLQSSETFYVLLMLGFALAILAEKYAFADADLKSEVITGLLMMGFSVLIFYSHQETAVTFIAPAMIGFGTGIIGSRFLLFYIKLAKHCQRGTSQSSFFLSWESGLSIGLFLGTASASHESILITSQALIVTSFILYNFIVHPWYVKHKNR